MLSQLPVHGAGGLCRAVQYRGIKIYFIGDAPFIGMLEERVITCGEMDVFENPLSV